MKDQQIWILQLVISIVGSILPIFLIPKLIDFLIRQGQSQIQLMPVD
jgi:hypothetical protein